jgi:hypothetical protein
MKARSAGAAARAHSVARSSAPLSSRRAVAAAPPRARAPQPCRRLRARCATAPPPRAALPAAAGEPSPQHAASAPPPAATTAAAAGRRALLSRALGFAVAAPLLAPAAALAALPLALAADAAPFVSYSAFRAAVDAGVVADVYFLDAYTLAFRTTAPSAQYEARRRRARAACCVFFVFMRARITPNAWLRALTARRSCRPARARRRRWCSRPRWVSACSPARAAAPPPTATQLATPPPLPHPHPHPHPHPPLCRPFRPFLRATFSAPPSPARTPPSWPRCATSACPWPPQPWATSASETWREHNTHA